MGASTTTISRCRRRHLTTTHLVSVTLTIVRVGRERWPPREKLQLSVGWDLGYDMVALAGEICGGARK